jgi:hypothetical protein
MVYSRIERDGEQQLGHLLLFFLLVGLYVIAVVRCFLCVDLPLLPGPQITRMFFPESGGCTR